MVAALPSDALRACAKIHSVQCGEGGGQRKYGAFAHSESTVGHGEKVKPGHCAIVYMEQPHHYQVEWNIQV